MMRLSRGYGSNVTRMASTAAVAVLTFAAAGACYATPSPPRAPRTGACVSCEDEQGEDEDPGEEHEQEAPERDEREGPDAPDDGHEVPVVESPEHGSEDGLPQPPHPGAQEPPRQAPPDAPGGSAETVGDGTPPPAGDPGEVSGGKDSPSRGGPAEMTGEEPAAPPSSRGPVAAGIDGPPRVGAAEDGLGTQGPRTNAGNADAADAAGRGVLVASTLLPSADPGTLLAASHERSGGARRYALETYLAVLVAIAACLGGMLVMRYGGAGETRSLEDLLALG